MKNDELSVARDLKKKNLMRKLGIRSLLNVENIRAEVKSSSSKSIPKLNVGGNNQNNVNGNNLKTNNKKITKKSSFSKGSKNSFNMDGTNVIDNPDFDDLHEEDKDSLIFFKGEMIKDALQTYMEKKKMEIKNLETAGNTVSGSSRKNYEKMNTVKSNTSGKNINNNNLNSDKLINELDEFEVVADDIEKVLGSEILKLDDEKFESKVEKNLTTKKTKNLLKQNTQILSSKNMLKKMESIRGMEKKRSVKHEKDYDSDDTSGNQEIVKKYKSRLRNENPLTISINSQKEKNKKISPKSIPSISKYYFNLSI